ncbi:MAG: ABC-2 transporter permease [Ruminococcus sp.]|uniref:ABC-2 transporter permease n=1 Tax=Ruminococcus sp. TaxID=41978 RepID=UPI0025ED4B95|nr:ABC-2 transporter permease [Ruminococcus sp.]MBO4867085.1 ABC-2 transporter permease [Ruminococcus sp.]
MAKRNLKGLLLSEWYMMRVLFIAVLVMVISSQIGELASTAGSGNVPIGLSTLPCAFGIMLLSTAFAYDNMKCIGEFRRSLPYSDRDFVLTRYIPPTVIVVIVIIMTPLMLMLGGAIHGSYCAQFVEKAAFVTLMNAVYSTLPVIFFYPMFFKFGYQKMQIIYGMSSGILIICSTLSMVAGVGVLGDDGKEAFEEAPFLFAIPVPVCAGIIVGLAVLYYVSYRISLAEYAKRDE